MPMKKKPGTIASYIKKFVENSRTRLNPYVVSGNLNSEYIRGNQNKKINARNLRIEDKKNNSKVYMEKKIFNRILPIYLTRYSILVNNMPIPGFKPTDNTAKRVFDSAQGNNFIRNFLVDMEFKNSYTKAIKLAEVYGAAWVKTGIDWSQGDPVCKIDTVVDGEKMEYTLKEGRPFLEIVPIDEITVDNYNVDDIDEINELVHTRVFSLDYIKARWGINAKKESVISPALSTHPKYSDLGFGTGSDLEYAYVYEYYKRPDAIYPKGRYTICCNDKIIHDGPLPYKNGSNGKRMIPFDIIVLQSVPNYLIGTTMYSQLIPIQDTYNSVKNRYLEYVNHIAIGQLYYWEGSLINKNTFSTKPGRLIGLKRNARPPQPVQKEKLSNEFISYLRTLEEDMLITAGLSSLTAFGISKSNMRTDGVIDKLDESDQNKLTNALDSISDAIIRSFKKIVYLEKERQEILTKSLSLAKEDDYVLKYKLGEVDAEQITIVNREFLMQSDQTLNAKLQQVNQLGLYNPQAGLSYLSKLELLEATQSNFLKETLDPVERATHDLITEEHFSILEKITSPKVEDYHIHQQHIFEHNLFRISPEVRRLKKEDPELYEATIQAISEHIKQHEEFSSQQSNSNVYSNAKELMGTAPKGGQGSRRFTA